MQQDQAKQMWAEYQRQLRAMLQSSRDARLFHRDVKEMADDKLKQALTDRNINNQGHRIAMEERLLRSELRKKHPYDDVPWYPEFDELGGGSIPFIETGLLADLERKAARQATRKKRGPKPTKTVISGGEIGTTEGEESGGSTGEETRTEEAANTKIPTVLSLTTTTTTITVTTSARPITHAIASPSVGAPYQPPSDERIFRKMPYFYNMWLRPRDGVNWNGLQVQR